MKRWMRELLGAVLLGSVVPWVVVRMAGLYLPGQPPVTEPADTTSAVTESVKTQTQVDVLKDGTQVLMDMDAYLTGVLLCEMPGEFELEAKKAQAVVARTYALKTAQKDKHPGGAVCTDSACCQGYREPEEYNAWVVEEAALAVAETSGQVLTYRDALIEATYFSCSGGMTEAAAAVWGSDIPYLQAVESPGEEGAAHYTDTVTFTAESFQKALGVKLKGSPGTWFGETTYTAGGGVATVEIGGETYKGTKLRTLLSLRSTAFTVTALGDSILITTRGYGHRVGMSQYGAEAMAVTGSDYRQILEHYYPGTELKNAAAE